MLEIPDVMKFEKPSEIAERLKPHIENEEELKKNFGMALGQGLQAFDAALSVCDNKTNIALYITQHWVNDPAVVASKDLYLKTVYNSNSLLDADELAARLLDMAEERNATNTFYMLEGKDRLAALKLYADIRGFTKKDLPVQTNFIHNTMTIKLVEPEVKTIPVRQIDATELDNTNNNEASSPIKLKLVG